MWLVSLFHVKMFVCLMWGCYWNKEQTLEIKWVTFKGFVTWYSTLKLCYLLPPHPPATTFHPLSHAPIPHTHAVSDPPVSDPPLTLSRILSISRSHTDIPIALTPFMNWAKTKRASLILLNHHKTDNPLLFQCNHVIILIQITKTTHTTEKENLTWPKEQTTEGTMYIPTANINNLNKQRHNY